MEMDFSKEAKLFMVFDILGDINRTGLLLWRIDRKRLEDVKNHAFDVLLIIRILKRYLQETLNYDKMTEYAMCHDLPEAITGDITKFQGISDKEIKRVNNIAIEYLIRKFDGILDFSMLFNDYENRVDIESKVVNMVDKVHAMTTILKYQSEKNIDINDPKIIPVLRNNPMIVKSISEGKDLADIFFDFHSKAINISDDECEKYGISRIEANKIVAVIKEFAVEMYNQKLNGTLLEAKNDFPAEAMIYKSQEIN